MTKDNLKIGDHFKLTKRTTFNGFDRIVNTKPFWQHNHKNIFESKLNEGEILELYDLFPEENQHIGLFVDTRLIFKILDTDKFVSFMINGYNSIKGNNLIKHNRPTKIWRSLK